MQDDDHSSLGPSETSPMRSSTPTPSESTLGPSDAASDSTSPTMTYSRYQSIGKGLASSAQLTENGQILVSLDLKKKLPELPSDHATPVREFAIDRAASDQAPPMSIVIMIVGSRGDVQPYIALGNRLKEHGHRVRIATHETFRKMVKDAGLEFQSIGGDPAELMSYMVRNPGLLPGTESLLNGDIPKKRKMLTEILNGCWKACIHADEETGTPFAADAIISNPPAFAHIHCAEALGIPLHLSFTMPWCATTAFPHPLVSFKSSNAEGGLSNYLSYATADLIQWQGPTLIPKPKDWMNHIDVVGFYFLEGAKSFKPDKDLEDFLAAGPPPVYIGFGSVVVEDAAAMTHPQRVAVWWSQEHYLRLSAFAAQILVDAKVIKYENLLPHRMS
ncbi:hypothetical protein FRC00_004550 [Tulasnella sp. 408]|nr:hypothetical protein FRC00_004550 [Tulasnella sp. 408]